MFPALSRAGTSIFLFGIYLVILGLIFTLVPNTLLRIINLPDSQEVWIRLVGMLLLIMAFYYLMAGRTEARSFYHWTLYTRLGSVFFLVGFVTAGWVSPIAFIFWLADLAGAAWTWSALRQDRNHLSSQSSP